MRRLKIILKSRLIIYILLFILVIRLYDFFNSPKSSIYKSDTSIFTCVVSDISNKTNISLDCGETLIGIIYIDNDIEIGDILELNGNLKEFDSNKNFNMFNYKEYQNKRGIYYQLIIDNYKKIGKSNNIFLNIKNIIYKRLKDNKSYNYLNSFILGNKSEIDDDIIECYKYIGIIHLFSISGMHISFLIRIIDKLYVKRNNKKIVLVLFILFFYYKLVKTISLLRCLVFYLIKEINELLELNLSKIKILFMGIILLIIISPNSIFNIGFYYSVIISGTLYYFSYKLANINNSFYKALYISFICTIISLPLNIYSYSYINVLSFIYNLLLIPYVTFIMFPLSILTIIFPFIDSIMMFVIKTFESICLFFSSIDSILIFMKPNIFIVLIYYIIIYLFLINKKYVYILLLILFIHYNINYFIKTKYVLAFDVGQGDSTFIHLDNTNILIDTGGITNYNLSRKVTIPTLMSLGIRKIDYLILTHGDYDHVGEAINLLNNFNIDKVIFNCGELNDLEKEIIDVIKRHKISFYLCIKELNIDDNKLLFLNTREYDNENDNSNVIYLNINNNKFLFMGDASSVTEYEIINKYKLSNIDVLKVGHHGSKTSSSKEFIERVNPKYSIISVGKNNRYGHPNKEVLDNLEDSKIYRTDEDGSIMFKIINSKVVVKPY